jgi:hypothetical protein
MSVSSKQTMTEQSLNFVFPILATIAVRLFAACNIYFQFQVKLVHRIQVS